VPAAGPDGASVTYTPPSATDVLDGTDPVSCLPASGSTFALGTTTVSCSATDEAGKTTTGTFTITVMDVPPVLVGVPSDFEAPASELGGAPLNFTPPTATDVVDGTDPVSCNPSPGTVLNVGTWNVFCSATDGAGNTTTAEFHFTVQDVEPTVQGMPANQTIPATGPTGAVVTYAPPTATSVAYGPLSVGCTPASGSTFPVGTTPVTCLAIDLAGDINGGTFKITVNDVPPVLHGIPANQTVPATSASGATVTYTPPTATDVVDGTDAVSCLPASGSTFPVGTTTVSCSATDAAENTTTGTFKISVNDVPPVLHGIPANQTVPATSASGATVTYTPPTASDVIDGTDPVSCLPASEATFPLTTTTVSCTTTDKAGSTTTGTFKITVNAVPPVLHNIQANQTLTATASGGVKATYTPPTATDVVDGTDSVTCTPASGSTFGPGATIVSCSATDKAGNTTTGTFKITVNDVPPVLHNIPANQTLTATGLGGAKATYTSPSATDVVDGTDPVLCSPASGSTFGPGTTTVSCSATDKAGSTTTATFKVTVKDTTPPVLHGVPANRTLTATSANGASDTYTPPTATDLVDGSDPVSCSPPSGSSFAIGATTVTCSATDKAGNAAKATFTVTVQVTVSILCTATTQDVEDSSNFKHLSATQQAAVEKLLTVTCNALAAFAGHLTPSQIAATIAGYDAQVTGLTNSGWLTTAQATTLRGFAATL
jgi:large repetitive protein